MDRDGKILVIGGAGYIGSHMVRLLRKQRIPHLVLDNLSAGFEGALHGAPFIRGSAADASLLDKIFQKEGISCVMHFASWIQVGESVSDPGKYYDNNVASTITLLNAMVRNNVPNFVFSSTAAVFGDPEYTPIDEQHPKNPINPYGRSKHFIEEMLKDYGNAYHFNYGVLRYFNAAGASPDGDIGECHKPETHLVPLCLQVASGRREKITIFGEDYHTDDGSCVRDYIHVDDLADAHLRLVRALESGAGSAMYNLGTGQGYSVKEIIRSVEKVTGVELQKVVADRRSGDPAILVADGREARKKLGWEPVHSGIETIIRDAWGWEQKLTLGHPFKNL